MTGKRFSALCSKNCGAPPAQVTHNPTETHTHEQTHPFVVLLAYAQTGAGTAANWDPRSGQSPHWDKQSLLSHHGLYDRQGERSYRWSLTYNGLLSDHLKLRQISLGGVYDLDLKFWQPGMPPFTPPQWLYSCIYSHLKHILRCFSVFSKTGKHQTIGLFKDSGIRLMTATKKDVKPGGVPYVWLSQATTVIGSLH